MIKTFTHEAWQALTPARMQQELSRKNIIVRGWPLGDKISFNEAGLRKVAGAQFRQISINGNTPIFRYCLYSMFIFQIIPSSPPTKLAAQRS